MCGDENRDKKKTQVIYLFNAHSLEKLGLLQHYQFRLVLIFSKIIDRADDIVNVFKTINRPQHQSPCSLNC